MCPRCQQLSARRDRSTRGCGSARVPRASPAESEWTGSHVRPAPLRLSRNVTTTAAIFASFRFVRFLWKIGTTARYELSPVERFAREHRSKLLLHYRFEGDERI